MKLFKRLFLPALLGLGVLLLILFLVPLDHYIPRLEERLSAVLQERVRVGHMRFSLASGPGLVIEDVAIGQGGQQAKFRTVEVGFGGMSLLRNRCLISSISVEHGHVSVSEYKQFYYWLGRDSTPLQASHCRVDTLFYKDIRLQGPDFTVPGLSGHVQVPNIDRMGKVWVEDDASRLSVVLQAMPDGTFTVSGGAEAWALPEFPKVRVEKLQLQGVLSERQMLLQHCSARLRGVDVSGHGSLVWSPAWRLEGEFEAEGRSLQEEAGDYSLKLGKLQAHGAVSAEGQSWKQLQRALAYTAEVRLQDGRLGYVDWHKDLLLDEAQMMVAGDMERLTVSDLEAKLYGGTAIGLGSLDMLNRQVNLGVAYSKIDMKGLVPVISQQVIMSGRMEGQTSLSMRFNGVDKFPANTRMFTLFHLRSGEVGKLKLMKAVNRSVKRQDADKLHYQDIAGVIAVDGNGFRLANLMAKADLYDVEGFVNVSPGQQLEGALDVSVKQTAQLVTMPLLVGGTLNEPSASLSGSSVTGAALGTALLGPGVGTALGMGVGGLLEKLLRRDPEVCVLTSFEDEAASQARGAGKPPAKPGPVRR